MIFSAVGAAVLGAIAIVGMKEVTAAVGNGVGATRALVLLLLLLSLLLLLLLLVLAFPTIFSDAYARVPVRRGATELELELLFSEAAAAAPEAYARKSCDIRLSFIESVLGFEPRAANRLSSITMRDD